MTQPPAPPTDTPVRSTSGPSRNRHGKQPPSHHTFSLLGSASEMQRDPLGFLLRTQQAGEVVRLRFLFSPAYLISHPASIKYVLQEHARNYNKDLITYTLFRPFLGQGLLTNDGPSWLQQRRLIQPAFHRQRLLTYGPLMTEATVAMLERWQAPSEEEKPLPMEQEMMRLTLQIVGQALFSLDLASETSTIGAAVTTVLAHAADYVFHPFPPLSVPTPRNRRMQRAIHELDQLVYRMIAERRARETEREDVLALLLSAQEETGQGMTDRQVRDEVMTLLMAGHETTANTLAWTWYLLNSHPQVERRLQAELEAVLGGRLPTVEDLAELKCTRMILQEALRLYPAAPVLSRKAIAADVVQGYPIAANSTIIISPYAMHRHPAFWDEPERFDPERFTPERAATRPAFTYFPFGGGPRVCLGNHFAMMEAQLILATVAQRYQVRLLPGHPVEPQMVVTLRPRYGLPMIIQAADRTGSQQ